MIAFIAGLAVAKAPEPFEPCDVQAAYYATQQRPSPAARPTLWWITRNPVCPFGQDRQGSPPPDGFSVGCADFRGHLFGLQSSFGPDGKVLRETQFDNNKEMGPRLEWDPVTYTLIRQTALKNGRFEGEMVEWLADGGTLVITYEHGARTGPTWRLDQRERVLLIEHWRGGGRHGRTCAWRDGTWVEQVWTEGEPAGAPSN